MRHRSLAWRRVQESSPRAKRFGLLVELYKLKLLPLGIVYDAYLLLLWYLMVLKYQGKLQAMSDLIVRGNLVLLDFELYGDYRNGEGN